MRCYITKHVVNAVCDNTFKITFNTTVTKTSIIAGKHLTNKSFEKLFDVNRTLKTSLTEKSGVGMVISYIFVALEIQKVIRSFSTESSSERAEERRYVLQ